MERITRTLIALVALAKVALFKERLGKFNARAHRNNLDEWAVVDMGEVIELERRVTSDYRAIDVQRRYRKFQITAAPLQIGDHTFIASVEQTGKGAIIRQAPHGIELPEHALDRYRNAQHLCDHCNVKRNRLQVYLVHDNATGAIKQLGKSCLRLYLGTDGPKKLLAYEGLLQAAGEWEEFGGGGVPELAIEDYLAHVVAHCRVDGWRSSAKFNGDSTAKRAWGAIFEPSPRSETARRDHKAWKAERAPTAADDQKAVEVLAKARAVTGDLNEFEHNLATVARLDYVDSKKIGLAAYLVPHVMTEVRNALIAAAPPSSWIGEAKKRYKNVKAVYEGSRVVTGYDWQFWVHSFRIGDDRVTWKTGSVNFPHRYDVAEGAEVVITYTVKSHAEYRGRKETRVARVAVPK